MGSRLLRRAGSSVLVIWLVLTLTFAAFGIAPGRPAVLSQVPTVHPSEQDLLRQALGLDQSLHRRYADWLLSAFRGDLGASFTFGRPVLDVMLEPLPASALLGSTSLLIALLLGVAAALYCGLHPHSTRDRTIGILSLVIHSTPTFWLGLLALMTLSSELGLFPPGHLRGTAAAELGLRASLFDRLHHLALPALVLGTSMAPTICLTLRASVLETLAQPYVRTARARGLSELRTLLAHVLPNALGPLIQVIALSLPAIFGGVLVIEVVFSWPGLGRMAYSAAQTRDYPLLLGTTALTASAVVCGTFLADLVDSLLDPRWRTGTR